MSERPPLGASIAVVVGLGTLALVAFDAGAWTWWSTHVTAALPQRVLQAVFVGAVLTHLGEALYALQLVRRLRLEEERARWFWSTLLLGFPSLGILVRRSRAAQC